MATNRYETKVCPHFLVLEERDDLKSDTATFEERYTMVTNWVGTGLKFKMVTIAQKQRRDELS